MDTFMYYLQMVLSYGLALLQLAMYFALVVALVKVTPVAVKALKTYVANNKVEDACTCGCCAPAEAPAAVAETTEAPAAE